MPIIWNDGPNAGQPWHVGAVLEVGTRTVRVMSDVWENEQFAAVWTGLTVDHVVLDDWAYVARGGGWTKNYEKAADGEAVPPTADGGTGYFRKDQRRFHARAEADATEEVLGAVAEWRRVNGLIEHTRSRLRRATVPTLEKDVEVVRGRKVPHGGGYEVTSPLMDGAYGGHVVHLRDTRGQSYRWVNVENLRVVRPERYVDGPVACPGCRLEFDSATAAGMEAGKYADGMCSTCRLVLVLDGKRDVPMPRGAVRPAHCPFKDKPPLRGTQAEGLVRAVAAEPDDMTAWLVLCDWLEENGDGRHGDLRVAILGETKKKAAPIRRKDLKVSGWRKSATQPAYGRTKYECVVTGFPPAATFNEVAAVAWVYNLGGGFRMGGYEGRLDGKQGGPYIVSGTLLRQVKAVVPTFVLPSQEVVA